MESFIEELGIKVQLRLLVLDLNHHDRPIHARSRSLVSCSRLQSNRLLVVGRVENFRVIVVRG